jgi:hypothetical protein
MTFKNILNRPFAAGCTVGLILLAGVMYPQSAPRAPRAVTDRELLENPAMRVGAGFPIRNAGMSAHGWSPVMTWSSTSSTSVPP